MISFRRKLGCSSLAQSNSNSYGQLNVLDAVEEASVRVQPEVLVGHDGVGDHLLGPVEEGVGLPDGVQPVHWKVAERKMYFLKKREFSFLLLLSLVIGGEVGWDLQPRVEPALLEEHVDHQGLETKTRVI